MNRRQVILTDVTGRDGFQMERNWIQTEDKIHILNGIISSGVSRMEATSFVSPKAVPQMRDAADVLTGLAQDRVETIALVPNLKGAERALTANVDELNVVVSVSETHNQKNINRTVEQSVAEVRDIHRLAEAAGKSLNVCLATTFGCPFEGGYGPEKFMGLLETFTTFGIRRFTLADTTGMANPAQLREFIEIAMKAFPDAVFSLHLHNTRGMGLANAMAAYEAGIRRFDASTGGIGGCPFAPGATGNIPLEDTAHMFELMGIGTGIDIERLIGVSRDLERVLGYSLPGQVMKAGLATKTIRA